MTKVWLFSIFVVLWIADTLLTMKFVKLHGLEMEANPIPRYVMEHFGMVGFCAFKAVMMAPLVFVRKHVHNLFYSILILIMVPVVYRNVIVAFDLLGQ